MDAEIGRKIRQAVREAGINEQGLTANAVTVLERRYLAKDKDGRVVETPEEMFRRVAGNLSEAETEYGAGEERRREIEAEFHDVMSGLEFLPNSPALMNAGRELQQLSACFVLPVDDSLESIFEAVKQTALIHKSGGGTGFSFARLRPGGDVVGSTGGVASGPVSFIGAFDAATEVVKQGSTRRGANMAILNVDHPDILEFIRAKREPGRLANFNISVAVTQDFMERARKREEYDLVNPRNGRKTGSLGAREVFDEIVESAWATGDPGLVFLDRINAANPNPHLGRIESTNPCVTGDDVVMTQEGPFPVSELVGKPFEAMVDGTPHPSGPQGFFHTGRKEVVRITGSRDPGRNAGTPAITLTPDHMVLKLTEEGTRWTPAGEIRPGDRIRTHDHRIPHRGDTAEPPVTTALVSSNKVAKIELAGEADVYDVRVPGVNAFDANSFYVHNCGEQPLAPHESCNLGSVNLARMVRERGDGTPEIAWDRMAGVIKTGVRMLDNSIDMNRFPIPEIGEMSRETRRIGIGVMGWADMLVQLGIRYDSEEALELAEEVMKFVREEAHRASRDLAAERGEYPAWAGSIYSERMRNSAPVTIAPTGTISIIAGASSGIEPLFALSYARNVMDGTKLVEVNPYFDAVTRQEGLRSEELMEELARTGSLSRLDPKFGIPQWIKDVFRTSHEIDPHWHVLVQAAFQKHTDNSVSKTVNLPAEATREDVNNAYALAYALKCNGITVYRDGSKAEQVLSAGTGAGREETPAAGDRSMTPLDRPRLMRGITERFRTGHGNMYVTLNFDEEDRPFEIFTNLGKAGGCDSAQLEAASRLASLALRSGIDPGEIIYNLQGITCCPAWDDGKQVRSAPDAMAHMLRSHWAKTNGTAAAAEETGVYGRVRCPDCNAEVEFQEGCEVCRDPACGWTRCH